MPSYINTNISSLNAQRNLNQSQSALATSLQRLSSGLRINSARDDAAGMAISSRMTSQINGNNQATRNANDGISLAQTAEGDLAQIGTNLQRMRDLAVQSANATNSATDRAALQSEVASLAAEIDRVAQNSSFNGVKLLDGSFTAQNFQVGAGATANDQIAISAISSARTSAIGSAGTTSTATHTGTATTTALAAGDLTLNGQQVGASTAGTGGGLSAASATQIAIAINAVSAASTVTATANANTVTGTAATVFGAGAGTGAIAANTFSINGIAIGAISGGATAAGQGANVAAAINGQSTQTGVTASADAVSGALTLTAADGRDISIALLGSAATTAAAAANKATFLTQTGLATGVVGTRGNVNTNLNTLTFTGVTAAAQTFTLNGVIFTSADATGASTVVDATHVTWNLDITNNNNTATLAATSLNAAITLAKAGGAAQAALSTVTNANPSAGVVTITDVAAGVSATTVAEALTNAANVLTQAGAAATAAAAADNHGTIKLESTGTNGIVVGGAAVASAGMAATSYAATAVSSVSAVSTVSVATAAGSLAALAVIDGAIASVNTSRASLGAYQNRFGSVVTSLQTTSENLTASRSRIMDTDFAAETSQLTRNQILQQAGTAMLAQANQLPQSVLTLLR